MKKRNKLKIIKSDFVINIEKILREDAVEYTPEGTEPEALIHQWLQGIYSSSETDLFPSNKIAKKMIFSRIKKSCNSRIRHRSSSSNISSS